MDNPHFSHPDHELIFRDLSDHQQIEAYNCKGCSEAIVGPAYVCDPCKFGLHKSCAELTGEIPKHPLHDRCDHPLNLSVCHEIHGQDYFICDGCRCVSNGFTYACKSCKFNLDVTCAFKQEGDHDQQTLKLRKKNVSIPHFCHEHELKLFTTKGRKISMMYCCCCLKHIVQDSGYCCIECSFFVHESCLSEIPPQIRSVTHSPHPLVACPIKPIKQRGWLKSCHACLSAVLGFCLRCEQCNINVHVSCAKTITRALTHKCHRHNMFYVDFFEGNWKFLPCSRCNTRCLGPSYHCMECHAAFHLECIPIPRVVKHESHEDHDLMLVDSIVLKNTTSSQYRCDNCEMEGDQGHHAYYCEECNYVAHIECVISEDYTSFEGPSHLNPSWSEGETSQQNYSRSEGETSQQNYVVNKADELQKHQIQSNDGAEVDDRIAEIKNKIKILAIEQEVLKSKREQESRSLMISIAREKYGLQLE